MSTIYTVFVYGTLRKGERNRRVMEPHLVRELGPGRIQGTMCDLGWFPAVVLRGKGVVVGEWVEITEAGLAALDRLEAYPRLYDRSIVADLDSGTQGFVYHMRRKPARAERIECGDWVAFRAQKREAV
ncbi:MAG: gamma-glutamylcyclotransferase [Alicyclobacillus sp.]|nr:gamma-glutamylcyclotransferase [Alicyclobacillus sp.]